MDRVVVEHICPWTGTGLKYEKTSPDGFSRKRWDKLFVRSFSFSCIQWSMFAFSA